MASTIGTARGSTQGSWRPWASQRDRVAVAIDGLLARCEIVAVGLKATRKTMSSPLLMPPCTPPERLLTACAVCRPASVHERIVVLRCR